MGQSEQVRDYLNARIGVDLTAKEVADALGIQAYNVHNFVSIHKKKGFIVQAGYGLFRVEARLPAGRPGGARRGKAKTANRIETSTDKLREIAKEQAPLAKPPLPEVAPVGESKALSYPKTTRSIAG